MRWPWAAICWALGPTGGGAGRLAGITSLAKSQVSEMARDLASGGGVPARPLDAAANTFIAGDALILKTRRAAVWQMRTPWSRRV